MAYIDQPTRVALEFESNGMRVSCTSSTLAARIAVERFERRVSAGKEVRDKDVGRLAVAFVRHVTWWNIRRESGAIVPRTAKGVLSLDRDDTLLPMLKQWAAIVVRSPAPVPAVAEAAPVEATDPDEAILAAMEARTLTEPGEHEQLVAETPAGEPAPVLEPV